MCAVCYDFQRGRITIKEAYKNLEEIYEEEDEHSNEVWIMLLKAEASGAD